MTNTDKKGYSTQLNEDVTVRWKHNQMIFPKSLQYWAVAWCHHYQQHPRTKCLDLEETLHISMF